MIKKIFILLTLNLINNLSFAQTTNWLWAKNSGGTNNEASNVIKTDAIGNVYIAGYFKSPTIMFDTVSLTDQHNGLSDNTDWFVAKYDANGNVLWAKNGNSLAVGNATSIAVDNSGNVYVVGEIRGLFTIGSVTIQANGYASDIFYLKYDANGILQWVKRAGGPNNDGAKSIAIDASGNFYMSGYFGSDTLILGADTLLNAQTGSFDIFLAKFDADGNPIWAKCAGGTNNDIALSVAVDNSNNAYITGYMTSPSVTFGTVTFVNTGVFLVKYNTNGNVLWAKNFQGTQWDLGASVAVDNAGNSFVAGYFKSHIMYIDNIILTNNYPGYDEIFLVKSDAAGNALWARRAGGEWSDRGYSVAVDADGASYCVGGFTSDSVNFGAITLYNSYANSVNHDIFIAKYDANGNVLWAKNEGGYNDDFANSVALDASDNIFITGAFMSPSLVFNNITLTNHDLIGCNTLDIFIAKMDQQGLTGIADFNQSSDISLSPNPFSFTTQIIFKKIYHIIDLDVYNLQGKKVYQNRYTDCYKILLNRNQLCNGLYFLKIVLDENRVETKKIIINN